MKIPNRKELVTKTELLTLRRKAKRYDELRAIVDKFYEVDDKGEPLNEEAGLDSIGEAVAYYLGYL